MNVGEMFISALSSLGSNKLRAFLTMLGILIGVAAIIIIVAIGNGGKLAIVSTLESNRVSQTIQILPSAVVAPGLPQPGQVLSVSNDDLAIARQFSGVTDVYYTLLGQAQIQSQNQSLNVSVEAGPSFLNEIARYTVVSGRMYTQADVLAHRSVALLAESTAQKLFKTTKVVGKTVILNNRPFEIIGTTMSSEANLFSVFLGSDYIYLPSTTCMDVFPSWQISELDIEVAPTVDKAQLAKREVMALNIHAHSANAFEDSSGFLQGIEKTVDSVTNILTLVIGAIAGIALLVGGVGVMNIMLVSVTERTEEIGVRMSLGATRWAILMQFLIESVTLTVIGGGMGIVLGVAISFVIQTVTHFSVPVSWSVVGISFAFSVVIGVVCGLYPANQASKLNPIDALRYE
jgi:putative ABC transport system permease protein